MDMLLYYTKRGYWNLHLLDIFIFIYIRMYHYQDVALFTYQQLGWFS
jgi:hypothetical protein